MRKTTGDDRDPEEPMTQKILTEVRDLTKSYQMGEVTVHALRGVDLTLYEEELVVVLGPSGSGKSTLLNIIGGMDTPTSGSIRYRDMDLSSAGRDRLTRFRRNEVGFIFQFYNLMPNLTALENVQLAARLSENPLPVDTLLEQVGLGERKDHFPAQLSGGEQQRVAIARGLSKNPSMLLCDEPTGALDLQTGIGILSLLRDFCRSYRKTVVLITHNSSIGEMADRVIYLKDGLIDRIRVNENPVAPEKVSW